MNFQEYLISKKIDSDAFRQAEPDTWLTWKNEFEQIHPNSFTLQKLNLLNPVRRKYLLTVEAAPVVKTAPPAKPALPRPMVAPAATPPQAEQQPTPPADDDATPQAPTAPPTPPPAKPAVPRPVFKPKPKTN